MSPLKHPASALPNLLSLHLFHITLYSLTTYYTLTFLSVYLYPCCFAASTPEFPLRLSIKAYLIIFAYLRVKWSMACMFGIRRYMRQLPTVARRLKLTYITTKHKYSVRTRACFQYSMYPITRCLMCVPSSCFINRVKKNPNPVRLPKPLFDARPPQGMIELLTT